MAYRRLGPQNSRIARRPIPDRSLYLAPPSRPGRLFWRDAVRAGVRFSWTNSWYGYRAKWGVSWRPTESTRMQTATVSTMTPRRSRAMGSRATGGGPDCELSRAPLSTSGRPDPPAARPSLISHRASPRSSHRHFRPPRAQFNTAWPMFPSTPPSQPLLFRRR